MCDRARVHWRVRPWKGGKTKTHEGGEEREEQERKRRNGGCSWPVGNAKRKASPTRRRSAGRHPKCQRTGAPNSASKQEKGNHPRTQPKGQRMQRIEEERVSGHILARPFRHQTMVEKSLDGETKQLKLDCSGVQFTGKRGGQGDQTSKTTAHLLELTKKRRFTTGHC